VSYLINRNPSGRLLCLHGLLQYVSHHWGDGPYEIKNFKFDATKSPDIHDFSPCLSTEYGFRSCRYLENPSSLAGCGLVNSLVEDTQKSKNASDVFNALDGLGFTTRKGNLATITDLGKKFIGASRDSEAWEQIAREGAQNYGPFAGLIYLTSQFPDNEKWVRGQINLGFSETGEEVYFKGEAVTLSTGSQSDTITRSRSSIINWGVASGYFIPNRYLEKLTDDPAQVQFKDYLMAASLTDGFWNTKRVYDENSAEVKRPLSYNQLVKSIRSLRENGQEAQRNASLEWETVIKNRRLAIAYALNQSASLGKPLIFSEFVSKLSNMPDYVIDKTELSSTIVAELGNAFVIGTPYKVLSGNLLQGVRTVDLDVLGSGADQKITDQLENLVSKSNLFEG
jgi:hypothetical protein